MSQSKLIIAVTAGITILLLGGGLIWFFFGSQKNTNVNQSSRRQISASDFATHATEKSCWVSFESKVYDVTNYLDIHPGGRQELIRYCGKAIDSVAARHPGGNFKDAALQTILQPLQVGVLI